MKRKHLAKALVPLFLLLILAAYSQTTSPVRIERISIEPSPLHPRVVLTTDSGLRLTSTYYAPDYPSTLVLEMASATLAQEPPPPGEAEPFITAMKVEPRENNSLRLLLSLKEKAPYRILSGAAQTVVELTKVLNPAAAEVKDPALEQALAGRTRTRTTLQSIEVQNGSDRINISARLNPRVFYNTFALANPLRLVIDLYDTVYQEPTSVYPVEKYGVDRLKVGQFKSDPDAVTRLVIDLKEPKYYSILAGTTGLTISFAKDQTAARPSTELVATQFPLLPPTAQRQPAAKPAESTAEKTAAQLPAVQPSNSLAVPQLPLQQPTTSQPYTAAKAQEIKVDKPVMKSPASSQPPAAEAPPETKSAALPGQAEQFAPKTVDAQEARYTGEVLNVKFKDADLRDVVLYLCEFAGLNVVFDPDVKGKVTCNFEVVPWDQILDLILKQNKMGKALEGNVLRVAPLSVLTREGEDERRLRDSKENAGPMLTKTITLSYSSAGALKALMDNKKSARGEVVIDDRTNTLIITDVKERMDLMEKLITVLDTPTPQVSIEARIVEATSTFVRNLGIQWGFLGKVDPFYGNQTNLTFPSKINVDGAVIPQGIVTKGLGGPLGGYAINVPAPAFNSAIGLSFANVLDTFRLDVALTAMETTGQGSIISSPKVTTQNNQEAEIIQGRQIPVQTQANFTVSTRYINAALELKAKPQITAEGTIIMTIDIKNNAADFANLVNNIPPIITQSAKTTVMVPDGGTTVIGGIYRTEDSYTSDRVPLLYKIPILGSLFRNMARTKTNRELLIFITPRIIK
jgi:type IV pilus secretin PilQ/predicted competence protein